jgi:hypothetical protein
MRQNVPPVSTAVLPATAYSTLIVSVASRMRSWVARRRPTVHVWSGLTPSLMQETVLRLGVTGHA